MKHLDQARGMDVFTWAAFGVSLLLAVLFMAFQLLR